MPSRPLRAYYLATPVFALLDLGLGVPVRAAGLDSPGRRLAYYAVLLILGWVMHVRPRAAPWLAIVESTANLTLLMLAVLLPVWSLAETLDGAVVADLPARVTNLALTGAVLVYGIQRNQAEAMASLGRPDPRPSTRSAP